MAIIHTFKEKRNLFSTFKEVIIGRLLLNTENQTEKQVDFIRIK